MAHELTISKGKAEMAFVGATPWHGLGQKLEEGAGMDQWRIAAGMDWRVESSPVLYGTGNAGAIKAHPTQRVLYRSDNHADLGIVSNKYKEVQPADVLDFFNDLVESNGFKMETAGTLFGGKRFWALANIGESAVVSGKDMIGGYILLCTACDGTMSTQARFTTVRVVCNNTLSMATRQNDRRVICVPHSSVFSPSRVKVNLGIAGDEFSRFMNAARNLSQVEMATMQAETFVEELLRETGIVTHGDINKAPAYSNIIRLFSGEGKGSNLKSAKGTAWGVVNAVTEYVDHHQKANSQSNRLQSAWFGRGEKLKSAAFDKALTIAA